MRGIILNEIGVLTFATCMLACCAAMADDERSDAEPQGKQTGAEAGSREPGPPPSGGVGEHILSEIKQIRQRLGADPYRGTILEDVKPADLEDGDSPPGSGGDNGAESGFDAAIRAVAAQESGRDRRRNGLPEMGVRHLTPVAEASPASVLRQAARRLEDEAADLDDVGLYPEADRLRLLADQFWQKARQFDGRRWPGSGTP